MGICNAYVIESWGIKKILVHATGQHRGVSEPHSLKACKRQPWQEGDSLSFFRLWAHMRRDRWVTAFSLCYLLLGEKGPCVPFIHHVSRFPKRGTFPSSSSRETISIQCVPFHVWRSRILNTMPFRKQDGEVIHIPKPQSPSVPFWSGILKRPFSFFSWHHSMTRWLRSLPVPVILEGKWPVFKNDSISLVRWSGMNYSSV